VNVNAPTRTLQRFTVNGKAACVDVAPLKRLSEVLREDLGLTGTKVGCDAGDCGACTVLIDGQQMCACLLPAAQAVGRTIVTVEGLARDGKLSKLQQSMNRHGAAQCGICTPGMLMAAADLLSRNPEPSVREVEDALGGVLCRCTGYRKIVDAVLDAGRTTVSEPRSHPVVGARMPKVDGIGKLEGSEKFGADVATPGALWVRAIRSPHARARFVFGDVEAFRIKHGLNAVLTSRDVPVNRFGIYPTGKDQPVLAEDEVRFRGEAVLALVGDRDAVERVAEGDVPVTWQPLDPVGFEEAAAGRAAAVHIAFPDNVLVRGRVVKGTTHDSAGPVAAEIEVETQFVEHAYIEPEAGSAQVTGDRVEIAACTQTPYMDRDEVAHILGLPKSAVRILPTATGGGFGGKLDVSVQPLLAIAAFKLRRPVRMVYTRPESMMSTTKRHPAHIRAKATAGHDGRLRTFEFSGDFNTGAYASWGPTVANRVPVHATGPYRVPHVRATTRAIHTNDPPAGAFRGFGVPQAAIAHEALMDALADRLATDRLEFRYQNALKVGDLTATGHKLEASVGLQACLEALRTRWRQALAAAESANRQDKDVRHGVGIACMWYGIGNTSLPNPAVMRVGLTASGRIVLYNGVADIGQGSNTALLQIVADALGIAPAAIDFIMGDTDLTEDAGKTSASRTTFIAGKAAELAALDLKATIATRAGAAADAEIELRDGEVRAGGRVLALQDLPVDNFGDVLSGQGRFDPPTTPLDANGQGIPYATYGFAAQMAEIAVDLSLGTVKVKRIVAAHDVGRAINPMLVEGQIHGGIAQGLGFALMEEYVPGRTENLHDYLIPTFGDMPVIETFLIEAAEPLGPSGAKGVGEPALIATAPAILGAIDNATGARITRLPATPDRVLAALKSATRLGAMMRG
jgi:CO/xanthine dehydrogenase Mo-binding subunit/aerobic-type carbon monoxide dehydrogenase small subunit (CoxS/CutS family)